MARKKRSKKSAPGLAAGGALTRTEGEKSPVFVFKFIKSDDSCQYPHLTREQFHALVNKLPLCWMNGWDNLADLITHVLRQNI